MQDFFETLRIQRWDDHRYYHHSRINQSLHLISAISFLVSYVYLFIDPVMAGLIAWLVSMTTRQIGHFFFEPKGFDEVNQATHEHKEEIKVGYNLQRKIVLLTVCGLIPVTAYFMPQYLTWAVPEAYEDTREKPLNLSEFFSQYFFQNCTSDFLIGLTFRHPPPLVSLHVVGSLHKLLYK